jgi:hypothetical protein
MPKSSDRPWDGRRVPLVHAEPDDALQQDVSSDPALAMQTLGIDYTRAKGFENAALYVPALSATYVDGLPKLQIPAHMRFTTDDLKFTNPMTRLCFYPWLLYSAGQAARTPTLASQNNWLTGAKHDPRVRLINDSGGFQIQQGTIPFQFPQTVDRMLRWMERTATYAMVLDFPLATVASGGMQVHVERLEAQGIPISQMAVQLGFDTGFLACLVQTGLNNQYFMAHRTPGKTQILNIIQGRNERESKYWFDQMTQYSFDGWTFAGKHHSHLSMTLRRLIEMRDLGILRPGMWLHFLGVSTLRVGFALSLLQRALREHTDATDIQLSFDSGSPVDTMLNGYEAVTGLDLSRDRWSFYQQPTRLKSLQGNTDRLLSLGNVWKQQGENRHTVATSLGAFLTIGDLAADQFPGMTPEATRHLQMVLLIHHNTQAYFEAFRTTYRRLDKHASLDLPDEVQWLQILLREVFTSETPIDFINSAERELDALAMAKA